VPQLETLILMRESAPRTWSIGDVSDRVYVTADEARRILEHFERSGVLRVVEGGWACSDDPALIDLLGRVAAGYRSHLVRVARLIHSKASTGVREFARAFEMKKDRQGG
jgi:hypothetical protein